MSAAAVAVSPAWLLLREPADAAARSGELAERLERHLPSGPVVIHDLGGGSGAMGRWLAPRLPGPQHWVVHDRDADLLELAVAAPPSSASVTVEARRSDITRLTPDDLAGAGLVTASALLDLLTADELDAVVATCVKADIPALFTLNVVGAVELDPYDTLDDLVAAAFNDHQRRVVAGRRLLGPDAVGAATAAFQTRGAAVIVRPSPWRLAGDRALLADWFAGWLAPAVEQAPELAGPAVAYARRRRDQIAAGRLTAVVHHADLLGGVR
jgi:hypothetical protein